MPTPTRVSRSEDNPRSPAAGDGSGAPMLAEGLLAWGAGAIAQPPAGKPVGVRRQPMRIQPRGAEDVTHAPPPSDQRVGDQLAVTAPGHGFRTQDRRGSGPRELPQPPQRLLEPGRLHVVRVAAEAGAAPRGVGRVPSRRPAPTELGFVMVGDADRFERGGERIAGEGRGATRRRISPHVHHLSDPMGREQVQKLSELPSRVPDRVDHAGEVSLTAHAVEVRGGLTRPGPALDLTIWLSLTIPHLTSRLPRSPTPRAGRSSRGWPRATRRSRTWRVRFACPSPASINISACSSGRGWWRMRNRAASAAVVWWRRSEEHTSELQSLAYLVCRLLLEKKK